MCGYKQHDNQWTRQHGATTHLTLAQIATQLGTSERNLQRALSIERNLTEPMKELLDSGVISKTVAADVVAALDEEEQVELKATICSCTFWEIAV